MTVDRLTIGNVKSHYKMAKNGSFIIKTLSEKLSCIQRVCKRGGYPIHCPEAGIEPADTTVNRITTTFANADSPWIRNVISDKAVAEEDLMLAIVSRLQKLPLQFGLLSFPR
ncbi:hypothetical protein TNCT_224611 [Trichonephila clavata]|uniref:Uncharacterized protein n=1 Tax=Trichonephila clavata TaxID=2740835 RepID=A0A8X6LN07_TRICU|nr:hypothetical protein TNCT_224611 [Trichonephila clavata]